MKILNLVAFLLVVIGGLNWGLVGFFGSDIVASIFGGMAKYVYDLVGLSALYVAVTVLPKQLGVSK